MVKVAVAVTRTLPHWSMGGNNLRETRSSIWSLKQQAMVQRWPAISNSSEMMLLVPSRALSKL